MSALLDARGVSKAFAGVRAVVDASLAVEPASITALIGPNGAGKSTLFNCISGFLRRTTGASSLPGSASTAVPPHVIVRAGLGRTFQTARALTRMTVLDNVRLAAPAHPGESLVSLVGRRGAVRRREREVTAQAHDLLRLVRLDGHADRSRGNALRRSTQAARPGADPDGVATPDTSRRAHGGGQPAVREELLDHVLELRASREIAFLIVEHDLGFVMQASDRVVVMNEGAILMEGTPDEVRGDSRVIDAYLGAHAGRGWLAVTDLHAGYDGVPVLRGESRCTRAPARSSRSSARTAQEVDVPQGDRGDRPPDERLGALSQRRRHRQSAGPADEARPRVRAATRQRLSDADRLGESERRRAGASAPRTERRRRGSGRPAPAPARPGGASGRKLSRVVSGSCSRSGALLSPGRHFFSSTNRPPGCHRRRWTWSSPSSTASATRGSGS